MPRRGTARDWLGLLAAAVLLYLLLIQPNHPEAATWSAFRFFPLEFPLVLALLATAPAWGRPGIRIGLTACLVLMAVVKLADFAAQAAYLRPFNPVFDMHLLPAGWEMLQGSVGPTSTLLLALAAGIALVALAAAIWWATGRIADLGLPRPALLLLAPAVTLIVVDLARLPAVDPPGEPFTLRLAWEHVRDAYLARRNLADFRVAAAQDPFGAPPPDDLLGGLAGHDAFLMFVESYGRTAFDNPRYAPTITATLEAAEAPLAAAGLAVRSAWLDSPVVGGQSWLAHATLLSGLRIDNQGRYRALVSSPRRTLLELAADAGWRTAAVAPAITRAWPEAAFFGYGTVLAAGDLGYRGQPFNWVTMPDQFTLAAVERLLLDATPRAPVFAEIALISSHAPWTPVAPLLPWDLLGDGRIFDAYAATGDPPHVVWRDPDRVRDQFRQALDYTLATSLSFAERRAAAAPLVILLGDHQPAGFVNEGFGGMDVPIHLIGPPDLLSRIDGWGWTEGLIPGQAPTWPMEDFRDRFLDAFAGPHGPCGDHPPAFPREPLPDGPSC